MADSSASVVNSSTVPVPRLFPKIAGVAQNPAENTFLPIAVNDHVGGKSTKIILLSGFSDSELHAVIDAYRLNKQMPKAIFATVTEMSENFKVKDLLAELELEKKQIDAAALKKNEADAIPKPTAQNSAQK